MFAVAANLVMDEFLCHSETTTNSIAKVMNSMTKATNSIAKTCKAK